MLKSASGSRRPMGSRASLVSLASTSNLSFSSNERAVSSRSFGERSRGMHARLSSSSSLNLCSLATTSTSCQQPAAACSPDEHRRRTTAREKPNPPAEQGNCLLYTFLTVVFFRVSRHILKLIDLFRPDTVHVIDLLKTMLQCYRNEYCLGQHMAAFALASSSSISSSMGQTMSGAKLASRNRSLCGLLPCYSSEEFQPKARLIVPAESLVLNGDNDDAVEHWGHFADFDTIEDDCNKIRQKVQNF